MTTCTVVLIPCGNNILHTDYANFALDILAPMYLRRTRPLLLLHNRECRGLEHAAFLHKYGLSSHTQGGIIEQHRIYHSQVVATSSYFTGHGHRSANGNYLPSLLGFCQPRCQFLQLGSLRPRRGFWSGDQRGCQGSPFHINVCLGFLPYNCRLIFRKAYPQLFIHNTLRILDFYYPLEDARSVLPERIFENCTLGDAE